MTWEMTPFLEVRINTILDAARVPMITDFDPAEGIGRSYNCEKCPS